jgi:hypothetical protein
LITCLTTHTHDTHTQNKKVRWSDKIGQLLVEVHHTEVMEKTVPLLESMDEQGFRIVSNEANGNVLTEVPIIHDTAVSHPILALPWWLPTHTHAHTHDACVWRRSTG